MFNNFNLHQKMSSLVKCTKCFGTYQHQHFTNTFKKRMMYLPYDGSVILISKRLQENFLESNNLYKKQGKVTKDRNLYSLSSTQPSHSWVSNYMQDCISHPPKTAYLLFFIVSSQIYFQQMESISRVFFFQERLRPYILIPPNYPKDIFVCIKMDNHISDSNLNYIFQAKPHFSHGYRLMSPSVSN